MKKIFLMLLAGVSLLLSSCSFIASFTEPIEEKVNLSMDRSKVSVNMGQMDVINLKSSSSQNSVKISWMYDDNVIMAKTDNYSAVITGLSPGTTELRAICGSNSASCVITVSENTYAVKVTNPYVYASTDYVSVKPNETYKISAALFGGNVADSNGYTWTIDKPSVASITTEGNYCWITGKNDGIAKVTVRHNKAAYGYSVLVNCSSDGTTLTYITTSDNIITINLSETDTADFSIDLMNPLIDDYQSGFTFSVVDALGNEIHSRPVVVNGSGNLNVTLKAFEVADCYVRVSHPSALYDLDILVRVIGNAETAYIEPSKTLVEVSGSQTQNISAQLMNYQGNIVPDNFVWNFSENADEYINYSVFGGSSYGTGDNISVTGKKTGSVKIGVSYPGVAERSIIVLVRNVDSESADATCYITTSQNFIRLHPGDSPEQINITLRNATQDDVNSLKWTVTNNASDGTDAKVINWKNGNGTSVSKSARTVLIDTASAYCVIEPLIPGTAYIDITHPKSIYPTRITVVVSEKKTTEPEKAVLNLASSPVLNLKNGTNGLLSVSLSGNGSEDEIVWASEGSITISGYGKECNITSPVSGIGGSKSTVTASHPNADYPVTFTVICYDNEEEIKDFEVKSIYSYQTDAKLYVNQMADFVLETSGLGASPQIRWTVTSGNDCISIETQNQNKLAQILALKEGKALIKASCDGCPDVWFTVTVLSSEISDTAKDCYISTSSNVLYFEGINQTKTVTVDLFNIEESAWGKLTFEASGNDYEISANNNSCTVTSLSSESSAVLRISHPLSENELVVYLKTGSRYEYVNEDSCYISVNQEVFDLYAGQDEVTLVASVNHTEESESGIPKGFVFESSDSSVASVSYVNFSNTCYIKPVKNGTATIKISHPDADFEKEVVVIVNPTPNTSSIPYITTQTNVVTIVQGEYAPVTVTLMNSSSVNNSSWHWTSKDTRIADVIANNGTSAMISANSPGTVEINVKHDDCLYSLNIIVVVVDASVITSKPYISTSSNIITIQKGSSTTFTAQMIGGTAADSSYFRFTPSSSANILVNAANGSCFVKGLNEGIASVTVYNSRYSEAYSKTVLIIVEDKTQNGIYITTSQSILKIKPDEKSLTTITATLVNGEATDGANFIWWADDYNIVSITSVADKCSVTPTGKNGTTKIHVKHEKSLKQADILVLVSSYDKFAFSSPSAVINAEQMYFYPLQIPSVEDGFTVKYSSSNEDVCLVDGSNSVAWVCGRDYGTASLTATMHSLDGTVLATAEMIVNVTVIDPVKPVISLGNSIMNVEAGTSKTFSAMLSGENVEETERYNLRWSVKNKEEGISLLNETSEKTAYGSDCYVTFNYGGEYVLECTHEASGATAELYLIVTERGEMTINLNSNLETVYKDDGSFTLTATLNNATDSDYKNIEWSAVKVGGLAIVSVSKAKGANCTVTPKNVGQTTVIAKIPNGQIATCKVIVKASMEISVDVGAIHVIPGYTEVVNYRTNPENATINWYAQMTTSASQMGEASINYFKIEDDTARKQLRITGLCDYAGGAAGTVTPVMVGSSSANLPTVKVYVDYNIEVKVQDTNSSLMTVLENRKPDTNNPAKFNIICYPIDLDVDIKADGKIIGCVGDTLKQSHKSAASENEKTFTKVSVGEVERNIITEDGVDKMKLTVSLVPHAEWTGLFTVTASLPSDESGRYSKKTEFTYNAYYPEYDIEVIDMTQTGAFTQLQKDQNGNLQRIVLGDGEEAVFYFKIKNENASGEICKIDTSTDWATSSGMNLQMNSSEKPFEKTRKEYSGRYFGNNYNNKPQEVKTAEPTKPLMYLNADTTSIPNTTVYHLAHGWDYYADLPDVVSGANWKTYYETHKWDESFFEDLKKIGVDYFLVSKEMEVNGKYAFLHPGKQKITAKWDRGVNTKKVPQFFHYRYDHRGWVKQYLEGSEVREWFNNDRKTDDPDINYMISRFYVNSNPFVVSIDELKDNNVLVRPNGYSPVGYSETRGAGWDWGVGDYDRSFRIPKVLFPDTVISPTVSKNTSALTLGSGTLTIRYKDYRNNIKTKNIQVTVQRRMCEAYTNSMWKKDSVNHYVLSDVFIDPTAVQERPPYLTLKTNRVEGTSKTVTASDLQIDYELSPKDGVLTVTVPASDGNGRLSLTNGTYVSQNEGTVVYRITAHASSSGNTASGKLKFELQGSYHGTVTVAANGTNLNTSSSISVNIESEDTFVPVIEKKYATGKPAVSAKGSSTSTKERILVIGDGETVEGFIKNLDETSLTAVSSVVYSPFTSSTTFRAATKTDTKGKKQSDLVEVSITQGSGKYSFTVKHSKDYGYFADARGNVSDEFYKKVLALSDMEIDESTLVYTTEYKKNAEGVMVIDAEKTEANRQKALLQARQKKLDEEKVIYASREGANAQSSYTFPYYYEEYEYQEEQKVYKLTPVGEILISYTDWMGDENQQEIILCVRIADTPCSDDTSYAVTVPQSYWGKLE